MDEENKQQEEIEVGVAEVERVPTETAPSEEGSSPENVEAPHEEEKAEVPDDEEVEL